MKLTKHLVSYERDGELLLLNGATTKPLLIRAGGQRILELLQHPGQLDDDKLVEFLKHHNILVDDGDDEEYAIDNRVFMKQNRAAKAPAMTLYLLLSQSCNQACIYCLNGDDTYHKTPSLMMTEETAFRGLDVLTQRVEPNGKLELVLFGGEPLLNWALAKKAISYCEEEIKTRLPGLTIIYHLTSNLTIFPRDLIDWARKYSITFLCNIDGDRAMHDITRPFREGRQSSHDASVRNIKKLKDAGFEVGLRATVTSHNMHQIPEISRHHKAIGGDGSAFVSVNAVNSDSEILDKSLLPDPDVVVSKFKELIGAGTWDNARFYPLNQHLERIRPEERNIWACGAPHGNTPVLAVNGDVYPCIYLVGIDRYRLGNVFSDQPYPDQQAVEMMMDIINIDNSPQCWTCNVRYLCGGGCPVGRLLIKGNPQADEEVIRYTHDISCKVNKAMIEESLWLLARKAEENAAMESDDCRQKCGC